MSVPFVNRMLANSWVHGILRENPRNTLIRWKKSDALLMYFFLSVNETTAPVVAKSREIPPNWTTDELPDVIDAASTTNAVARA